MSKIMNIIEKIFEKQDEVIAKYDDSYVIPTGGIVLNNKTKEIIDKLFTISPNEQVVRLLDDEIIVSADAISKLFIPNLQNLIKEL